jgi:hypothetical protein
MICGHPLVKAGLSVFLRKEGRSGGKDGSEADEEAEGLSPDVGHDVPETGVTGKLP